MDGERDPLCHGCQAQPKEDKKMRRRVIQDLLVRTQAWVLGRRMNGIKARCEKMRGFEMGGLRHVRCTGTARAKSADSMPL